MAAGGRRQRIAAAAGVAAAGTTAAYLWYYATRVCRLPTIHCAAGPLRQMLDRHCPSLYEQYCPPLFAFNAHAQTILAVLRRWTLDARYQRQLVRADDGGTIGLDYFRGTDAAASLPIGAPVLLVLHGVTGGSDEGYCKWMCAAAYQRGWRPVVMNFRGCNGLELTSPKPYSATFTDDVHVVIRTLRGRFLTAPLVAVGFSLGAVILTKYLSEAGRGQWGAEGSGLVGAAVVSNPCCLNRSSVALETPWRMGMVYNLVIAARLRQYVLRHQAALTGLLAADLITMAQKRTLSHFDTSVMVKIFGYRDLQHYYTHGSSQHYIAGIRTPTLWLVSRDDPFVALVPVAECLANPNIALVETSRGGHVAHLQGAWPFGLAWMDKVVADFLEGVLVCDRHGDEALTRSATMESLNGDEPGKQPARGSAEPTAIRLTASASASAPAPGSTVGAAEALQAQSLTSTAAREA